MDWKLFVTVLGTVFVAELGDKTQLATLLFATKSAGGLLTVFLAASLALILTSAVAVIAGGVLSEYISARFLSYIAGAGFIAIGIWTLWQA